MAIETIKTVLQAKEAVPVNFDLIMTGLLTVQFDVADAPEIAVTSSRQSKMNLQNKKTQHYKRNKVTANHLKVREKKAKNVCLILTNAAFVQDANFHLELTKEGLICDSACSHHRLRIVLIKCEDSEKVSTIHAII